MLYRQLHANEIPAVLDLWAKEMDVPRERIEAEFNTDPDRLAHTHVAVTEDGEIISAVHYFVRWIRDAQGVAQPVGAVAGVATRADHRGQGIASHLLQQSLTAMEADGCRWSLLFTEVNGFYEKLGLGISELGILPELPDGIHLLLSAMQREAQEREIGLGRVFLPREATINAAVDAYFQGIHNGTYEMLMGRPLWGYSMAEIEATFGAAAAIPWPADDF